MLGHHRRSTPVSVMTERENDVTVWEGYLYAYGIGFVSELYGRVYITFELTVAERLATTQGATHSVNRPTLIVEFTSCDAEMIYFSVC